MMTKRDNEIHKAAREHSDNRDNRMSFGCGARWADEHPNTIDFTYLQNWTNQRIGLELGMDADEVLRLKQITGIAEAFKNEEFSKSWEPVIEATE